MLEYRVENKELLSRCLTHIDSWVQDNNVKYCLKLAFQKSLKIDQPRPVPPLVSWVLAKDLGHSETDWAWPLAVACAYFYTAADLLDDIQDHDPQQPVLKQVSPEQAMNISNCLLMGAYRVIGETNLAPNRQLALMQLFTQMGSTMSVGQFWDLEATNQPVKGQDPEQIARAKAGAEFAGFLTVVPCALGLETHTYHQLGEEVGTLLQILTDYFDIWLVPNQQTLSQDLLVLKNSFPLFWARKDPQLGSQIEQALAGKNNLPAKQFQLRRMLAQTHTMQMFANFLARTQEKLSSLFTSLPALPHIQYLSNSHYEQAVQMVEGLKTLQKITQYKPWQPQRDVQGIINMGIDYLQFIPDFRDVWEVQRWGFLGIPIAYGDIFNPLLILEALAACGQNIQQPLLQLLQKTGPLGWHYFSNTQDIPTDTDDLGQILQLAALFPRSETDSLFQIPLQILLNNLDDSGKCPTWLADYQHHQQEKINETWFGNECLAVMANLYYGLACYDEHSFSTQIDKGLSYLVAQYQSALPGWQGVYYVSSFYTSYLVARVLIRQRVEFDFTDLARHVFNTQLLDGSWQQSPQETAFASLLWLQIKGDASLTAAEVRCLQSAQAFLIDMQLFDGSWPGEGLFIRPGKENAYEVFAHDKLTSAYCLRAIQQLQVRLRSIEMTVEH